MDWPKTSVFWDSCWCLFCAGFVNLNNMGSASRLQLQNCLHDVQNIREAYCTCSLVVRCFQRLGNRFLTRNNEPQTYSIPIKVPIRFVRVALSPQFFWHFSETAQDSGDWWVGRLAACLESQSGPTFSPSLEDGRFHCVHVRNDWVVKTHWNIREW